MEDGVVSDGRGAGSCLEAPSKESAVVRVLVGIRTSTVVGMKIVTDTGIAPAGKVRVDTTVIVVRVAQKGPVSVDVMVDGSLFSVNEFSIVRRSDPVASFEPRMQVEHSVFSLDSSGLVAAGAPSVGSITVDSVGVGPSTVIVVGTNRVFVKVIVVALMNVKKLVVIKTVQDSVPFVDTVLSDDNVNPSDVFVAVSFEYMGVESDMIEDGTIS